MLSCEPDPTVNWHYTYLNVSIHSTIYYLDYSYEHIKLPDELEVLPRVRTFFGCSQISLTPNQVPSVNVG